MLHLSLPQWWWSPTPTSPMPLTRHNSVQPVPLWSPKRRIWWWSQRHNNNSDNSAVGECILAVWAITRRWQGAGRRRQLRGRARRSRGCGNISLAPLNVFARYMGAESPSVCMATCTLTCTIALVTSCSPVVFQTARGTTGRDRVSVIMRDCFVPRWTYACTVKCASICLS